VNIFKINAENTNI